MATDPGCGTPPAADMTPLVVRMELETALFRENQPGKTLQQQITFIIIYKKICKANAFTVRTTRYINLKQGDT